MTEHEELTLDLLRGLGVAAWNTIRMRCLTQCAAGSHRIDLSYEDLHDIDLRGANLAGAQLAGSDLHGARLHGANLSRADLRTANLEHAQLRDCRVQESCLCGAFMCGADMRYSCLMSVDFSRADMSHSDIRGANLQYSRLQNADIRCADLRYADMRGARGLILLPVTDPRGYTWSHAVLVDGVVRIRAGCRDFTLAEAREHWGVSYEGERWIGDMYLHAVDWIESCPAAQEALR